MFLNPAVKCFYCSTASTNHKQFININKSLLLSDLNCLIWWKMPKQVYSTGDWRFQRSNRRFAAISLSIDHPVAPHEHWTSINCVYVQIVAHGMGITHFYTKKNICANDTTFVWITDNLSYVAPILLFSWMPKKIEATIEFERFMVISIRPSPLARKC